jgi:hypothetical protein
MDESSWKVTGEVCLEGEAGGILDQLGKPGTPGTRANSEMKCQL